MPLLLAILVALVLAAPAAADTTASGNLRLHSLGTFDHPTYVASAPGDDSRLFVVQKGGGIAVVHDGVVQPTPFLKVPNVHDDGEQGLLSMAFAPDYATSGRFYVYYNHAGLCTGSNCDIRVDEFRRGADSDHADPATQREVLTVGHREFGNHDGGQLQFGPDGMLWLGTGDGGGGGDTSNNAQNDGKNLGKLLRIQPATPGATPTIWAKGLRNPFRFSFDALTGDLLIGDVGQSRREEIDFQPAGSSPGANFGWHVCEGELAYPSGDPCPPNPVPNYVAPILTYPTGVDGTCAVIGGYVVRDLRLTELLGRYVYGDNCRDVLRSFAVSAGAGSDAPLGDGGAPLRVSSQSSFGQDGQCRVYVVSLSGSVYRLDPATATAASGCASAPPAVDRTAPILSRLGMLRRLFLVSRRATALRAGASLRRGSAFRYTLSESARVTFTIQRLLPGRRVGRRCLAATRARRRRPRCTRALRRGTLVRANVRAGRRSTPFSGRLGRRPLAAGSYRAVLRATDASGNVSRPRSLRFRIARP
jgi:hypothetical protein